MTKLSANLSLLYRELPLADRFDAARRDGFADVESWWPWPDYPEPAAAVIDEWIAGLRASGLSLRALNFYAGDMPNGVRGVLSHPGDTDAFRRNVAVVARIAAQTGCTVFNALYGQRMPGADLTEQDDAAAANLAFAANALAETGGTVVLEALKHPDNGEYPLRTLDDADAVRRRVLAESGEHLGLLFDTFHLAGNGVDLLDTITRHGENIAAVQYADFPGRGAPGTGEIDFSSVTAALEEAGFDGFIGCEFIAGGHPVTRDEVEEQIAVAVQA